MKYLLCFLLFFGWWNTEKPVFYSTDRTHDLEKVLVQALQEAKTSIFISVYSLNSAKIISVLQAKAQQGINVQVLVDQKASSQAARKLGPKITTFPIEGKGLMHHKIIIVDDKEVWLGSANLTRDSLRLHSNLMEHFTSEPLALWLKEKLTSVKSTGWVKRFPHKIFKLNDQTLEFWFFPDDPGGSLRIKDLIRSAQKTIKVAMYTFTRMDFAETLVKAANRGIDVQVILDRNMCEGACKKVAEYLKNSKVKLSVGEGAGLIHHKMMIVDGLILEHGSANWTKAAFTQNEDYFIVLYDLTQDQNKELEALWQALLNRSTSL